MPQQPFIGQNLQGTLKMAYPTPVVTDTQLIAILENNVQDYVAQLYGSPPPEGTNPDQLLVQALPIDWAHVQRTYAKDRTLQSTYNASISYDGEAIAFPEYTRDYIIRRANYAPLTKGTVLAGIVVATVTAAGTGYTAATASLSGGTGSGGAITPIVSGGAVVALVITAEGNYTVAPTVTINGDGSGATGTSAVQLAAAVLVKEDLIRTPDSPLDSLYVLVRRIYQTLPGVILTGHQRNEQVRGRTVDITSQLLASGASPETGDLVVESTVNPLSSVVDRRITKKVASLPPTEKYAYWAYVPIPTLLFDIAISTFCNPSSQASLQVTPDQGGGASYLRKHRVTIIYTAASPTTDYSDSTFSVENIVYKGKIIEFQYNNVLNDAISFTDTFIINGCEFTESYTFAASTPSATDFADGDWYVREAVTEPWGDSMWRTKLVEFYSAPGNPTI